MQTKARKRSVWLLYDYQWHLIEMANTLSLQLSYIGTVTGELFHHLGASYIRIYKADSHSISWRVRDLRRVLLFLCLWGGGRVPRENEQITAGSISGSAGFQWPEDKLKPDQGLGVWKKVPRGGKDAEEILNNWRCTIGMIPMEGKTDSWGAKLRIRNISSGKK